MDGTLLITHAAPTAGIALTIILGIFLLLCAIFIKPIAKAAKHGFCKFLKIMVLCTAAACVVFCAFLAAYGNIDTASGNEKAVIVLGCAIDGETPTQPLCDRLIAAEEFLKNDKDAVVVVSGSRGSREKITEAEAMKRFLVERGMDEDRIIKEDRSTSTTENFRFSKLLLDEKFGENNYTAVAVTNDFHIFRAVHLAKLAGMTVTSVHAPTVWYTLPVMYLREILAVIKMWVFKY